MKQWMGSDPGSCVGMAAATSLLLHSIHFIVASGAPAYGNSHSKGSTITSSPLMKACTFEFTMTHY